MFHLLGITVALYVMAVQLRLVAADDAATLVGRVLATNGPWLNPAPATGTYSLHFTPDGQADYTTGPFSLANGYTNTPPDQPTRVGSMVWTPLHEMTAQTTPYSLSSAGTTNWNGTNLTMVDVTFTTAPTLEIGMGGQIFENTRYEYSHATYGAQTARLLIETNNAVPIVILTYYTENGTPYNSTCEFDPFFLPLGNGRVPRAFDWHATWWLHERQEFQVVGSTWLFKRGDSWWETGNGFNLTGHILSCDLINLTVAMQMTVTRSGTNLSISMPDSQADGFSVEAADVLLGPWSLVDSQISPEGSSITVATPTNTPARFYRLTK